MIAFFIGFWLGCIFMYIVSKIFVEYHTGNSFKDFLVTTEEINADIDEILNKEE